MDEKKEEKELNKKKNKKKRGEVGKWFYNVRGWGYVDNGTGDSAAWITHGWCREEGDISISTESRWDIYTYSANICVSLPFIYGLVSIASQLVHDK